MVKTVKKKNLPEYIKVFQGKERKTEQFINKKRSENRSEKWAPKIESSRSLEDQKLLDNLPNEGPILDPVFPQEERRLAKKYQEECLKAQKDRHK